MQSILAAKTQADALIAASVKAAEDEKTAGMDSLKMRWQKSLQQHKQEEQQKLAKADSLIQQANSALDQHKQEASAETERRLKEAEHEHKLAWAKAVRGRKALHRTQVADQKEKMDSEHAKKLVEQRAVMQEHIDRLQQQLEQLQAAEVRTPSRESRRRRTRAQSPASSRAQSPVSSRTQSPASPRSSPTLKQPDDDT
jgi:hypothetical protein